MAVKNFRDLMPDLEVTDSLTDVHVSGRADPTIALILLVEPKTKRFVIRVLYH